MGAAGGAIEFAHPTARTAWLAVIPLRQPTGVVRGDHKPARLRARNLAPRKIGRQAGAIKVPLPGRRVCPTSRCVKADRLHPRIPGETPLAQALLGPRCRRAPVRTTQERVGAAAASRSRLGSGRATRTPDDPRHARLCARPSASPAAGGIASLPTATGPAESTVALGSSPRPRRGGFRSPLSFGRCSSRRASLRRTIPPRAGR
jgi:hypothetical protein